MLPALLNVRARSLRMAPRRALDATPPLAAEHRAPHAFRELGRRQMAEENKAPTETLRLGLVARRVHERVELLVRHTRGVDVERCEFHWVRGTFPVGREPVVSIGAHDEFARGDQ